MKQSPKGKKRNERSAFTNERLIDVSNTLQNIINMFNELIENKDTSMMSACKKQNLNYSNCRHLVKNIENYRLDELTPIYDIYSSEAELTAIEKLYFDIFNCGPAKANKINLPVDADETMHYVLEHTNLNHRQKYALKKRYFEHQTLEEIGEYFSVTRERIRQLITKALWTIKREHGERLAKGNNLYEAELLYKKELNDYALKKLKELYEDKKQEIQEQDEIPKLFPIDSLGLSVRAYNVLRRNGIFYLSELTKYTIIDLYNMRSVGRNTALEIETVMKEHNLSFTS